MRVIAGSCKGRRLVGPKSEAIRPVLDQVKEAVFNILFDVKGFSVLDLFAGTGAMGIEALSRGAKEVIFVDNSQEASRMIEKNINICGLVAQANVLAMTAARAIAVLSSQGKQFDLIFVDPPYEKQFVGKTLTLLAKSPLLHLATKIVVEHHPKEPAASPEGLRLTDQRKYGQTVIRFLKKDVD